MNLSADTTFALEYAALGVALAVAAMPLRDAKSSGERFWWFMTVAAFWPLLLLEAVRHGLRWYWHRWRDMLTDSTRR